MKHLWLFTHTKPCKFTSQRRSGDFLLIGFTLDGWMMGSDGGLYSKEAEERSNAHRDSESSNHSWAESALSSTVTPSAGGLHLSEDELMLQWNIRFMCLKCSRPLWGYLLARLLLFLERRAESLDFIWKKRENHSTGYNNWNTLCLQTLKDFQRWNTQHMISLLDVFKQTMEHNIFTTSSVHNFKQN